MNDADVQQGITVDLVLRFGLRADTTFSLYREMVGMGSGLEVRDYLAGSAALPQL